MRLALIILGKELRESLRDRRIIIGAYVMPFLTIFLITALTSRLEDTIGKSARVELTITGSESNPIVNQLLKTGRADISYRKAEKDAVSLLKEGKTNLVLSASDIQPGGQTKLTVYFDSGRPLSQVAFSSIREAAAQANSQALKTLLESQGVDLKKAEPLAVEGKDVAQKKEGGSGMWLMLIPYMVILWSYFGGSSIAGDMVAGEKEKKTLETLLLTPATRTAIVAGKLLSLTVISLSSGLVSVIGVGAAGLRGGGGLSLGAEGLFAFLLVLTPLVFFYAGALLTTSAIARSVREAQTYIAVLSILVLVPAMMSQTMGLTGLDRAEWIRWVPILNTTLVMNQGLRGRIDWSLALQAALISLFLAGIAWAACVQLFKKEAILRRV